MDVLCPSREEGGSCWRWRYAAGVERVVEGDGGEVVFQKRRRRWWWWWSVSLMWFGCGCSS